MTTTTFIRPLGRRGVLALAAGLAGGAVQSQSLPLPGTAPAKGPVVWGDMDQAALDAAYDQSVYAPNMRQVLGRYDSNSQMTRSRLGAGPRNYAYGSTAIERLDVFTTTRKNAPIHIFIHGGAWRSGLAKEYAFPAEMLVAAGAHYVVPDFINVLEAQGSLLPMFEQVKRAVAWVARNAAQFGGDASRIYLSGHSSGAHLLGAMLTTDWKTEFGLPSDVVKGAVCCSGLYDLHPVRLSARSSYVKFTDVMEDVLSPQRHVARISTPVVLLHGTLETPEFQRQSRDFAAALAQAGKPVKSLLVPGYNHFELIETLANPYGAVGHAVLEQMKLLPA